MEGVGVKLVLDERNTISSFDSSSVSLAFCLLNSKVLLSNSALLLSKSALLFFNADKPPEDLISDQQGATERSRGTERNPCQREAKPLGDGEVVVSELEFVIAQDNTG